ncbi:UNVERIFIED_CONTAM: hypothetical protein FKN15_022903 [Acipenser sinensis]
MGMEFEIKIFPRTGGFGPYNRSVAAFSWISNFAVVLSLFSEVFFTLKPGSYHCRLDPSLLPSETPNLSAQELLNVSIPWWDLVCQNYWKIPLEQICYMIGWISGYIVLGSACDRLGRRVIFLGSVLLSGLLGVGVSLSLNPIMFLFLRLSQGAALAGVFLATYVARLELCDPPHRLMITMIGGLFAVGGELLLPGLAVLCRDWQVMQLVVTLSLLLLLNYWWCTSVFPESPRWLLATQQIHRAKSVLQSFSLHNGVCLSDEIYNSENLLCTSVFPESPRWLLATQQIHRAKSVLQSFSLHNRVCLSDEIYNSENLLSEIDLVYADDREPRFHNICELVGTRVIWKNSLILAFTAPRLPRLSPLCCVAEIDLVYADDREPRFHNICEMVGKRVIWKNSLILAFTAFIGRGIQYCFTRNLLDFHPHFYFSYYMRALSRGLACVLLCVSVNRFGRRGILLLASMLTGMASLLLLALTQCECHTVLFIGRGIQYCFTRNLLDFHPHFYFSYYMRALSRGLACVLLCVSVNRFGRRGILLLASILTGMASLLLLALTQYLKDGFVVVLSIVGLLASQAVAMLSVFFASEVLPTVVRGGGLGLILAASCVGKVASSLMELHNNQGYFLHHVVFASFTVLSVLCVMLLPESKRKPLPDSLKEGENLRRPPLFLSHRNHDHLPLLQHQPGAASEYNPDSYSRLVSATKKMLARDFKLQSPLTLEPLLNGSSVQGGPENEDSS